MSFIVLVCIPLIVVGGYLWGWAQDQYSSVAGFTVRQEEGNGASELLGGLAALSGTSSSPDGDILYAFIQSQELVRTIDGVLGLREHYTQNWSVDPVFSLWPESQIEDLTDYWQRIVRVSHDSTSGLIELQVLAFGPQMAQNIVKEILSQSQDTINALNTQAREDAMRYARADLAESVSRLKQAREALTAFRSRTQIVDPEADLQSRMGVMSNLQQQLAEALITYDLLLGATNANDPRIDQAQRHIEVIRERISNERLSFATDGPGVEGLEGTYPDLIAEFEGLSVDREFAEETYRASLTALGLARADAQRESRYLATYIQPTLAEKSEYPQREMTLALAALFLVLTWSVLVLVYYAIRDRS